MKKLGFVKFAHSSITRTCAKSSNSTLERVWAILAQIIRSLDYFHSKGISHQNIKLENIFKMENGSIRLGDFGHSKVLLDRDDSAETGTKVYIAAEVWQNK
ncbi:MAG: hypothetical protein EZS28_032185, partial [Streblomastix strix]